MGAKNYLNIHMYFLHICMCIYTCICTSSLTEVSPKRIHLITAKDVDNIDENIGINAEYRKQR